MQDIPHKPERSAAARWAALATALVFAIGVAARLVGAWWLRDAKNPDYAVVVQMARHMAEGRGWPVFFYGQPYMGSLEPTVSGALVSIFGPAPFPVCLGTALFGIALLFAVHRWARECGGAWAGVLAVAAAAIGPVGYFQYMAAPRGGYALALLLTVLLLREGAGLAWAARRTGHVETGRALLLGMMAGLGFWNFWLTLPAVLTAGLLVVAGLRGRILKIRLWLAGCGGFAAGSAPFWTWNATHQWASFTSQRSASGLRALLDTLRLLLVERIPMLLDLDDAPTVRKAVVLVAYALPVAGAVAACLPRRGTPWSFRTWSLAGMVLFTGIFAFSYGASSFGAIRSPRYLLPFLPLAAVLSGMATAATAAAAVGTRGLPRILRASGAILLAACLAGTVATQLRDIRVLQTPQTWPAKANLVADTLRGRGTDAVMADYMLYGFNWATHERLCFSSPILERYPPFAQTLEKARHPAVIENFKGFNHFLDATRAKAASESMAGYRLHTEATPPPTATRPLPPGQVRRITDHRGNDWTLALTDQSLTTPATLLPEPDGMSSLEIQFTEPVPACGVRTWIFGEDGFAAWSVEGRPAKDAPFAELSPPHTLSGFYWSGPRFYFGGLDWRAEKRFPPMVLETLRITFHTRGNLHAVQLADVQALQDAGPLHPLDVPAIAQAVKDRHLTRVHADRWLANELHQALDGHVWTSREPSVFGEAEGSTLIQPSLRGTALAVEPGVEDSVRRTLARVGLAADEVEVGGIRLFVFRGTGGDPRDLPDMRFVGTLLAVDLPAPSREPTVPIDATFLRGRLRLVALSAWPSQVRPGELLAFEAQWQVAKGTKLPSNLGLFAHFLRDDRIAFQLDAPETFRPAPAEGRFTTYHSVRVPPDCPPGPVLPALGLCKYSLLAQRLAVETPRPIRNRRVVVPGPFEVLK